MWRRPWILQAWNRRLGPGIEPWAIKKIVLKGQGFEPWTHRNDCDARPGAQTLDRLKKIVCMIMLAITNMIVCMIIKIKVRTQALEDAWMISRLNVSGGWQTTARPTKNGWRTDCSKNNASVKKDMFPAKHIFFKVPHHVPNYVPFYRLNQPTAKMHVGNILQKYSSCTLHDECMIVFCLQFIFVVS